MAAKSTFDERVSGSSGPVAVAAGDISTSDEAMKVLVEQGVDAWREWVAAHTGDTPTDPPADQPEEGSVTASVGDPTVEIVDEQAGEMRVRFPVVVIEGEDTSDGRYLAAGSLTPRGLPLSVLAQPSSSHGGNEPNAAVVVGRIDTLVRTAGPDVISKRTGEPFPEGTFIWSGEGAIDPTIVIDGRTIGSLLERRYLRGVSVDLAGMDYEIVGEDALADDENPRRQIITHHAEIAAVTLVPIPAFGDAYVELASEDTAPEPVKPEELPEGLAASAFPAWRSREVGDNVLLAAGSDQMTVQIPADSVEQLAAVISDDGGEQRDATELASAIVEHIAMNWAPADDESDPSEEDTAMPTDAALADDPTVPPADPEVAPTDAEVVEPQGAGVPDEPQDCEYGDKPAVRSLLFRDGTAYVAVCDDHEAEARKTLEETGEVVSGVVEINQDAAPSDDTTTDAPVEDDTLMADAGAALPLGHTVVASAGPRPPADWFADPELDGPTALHVGEDGRIVGHLAAWNVPHIGMPNQRITAPKSASGYAYFRTGAILVDDGTEVPVGHITLDTGHAGTELGHHAAAAHYDSTGSVVADVAAGEDAHGIWIAGALRSTVDETTAATLRAAALSGDWRRIGSSLELVAALAVNVPGFPVPRVRSRVASGQPMSLVAAGAVLPVEPAAFGYTSHEDLADAIAARLEHRHVAAASARLIAKLDDTPALVAALLNDVDDTPRRAAALLADLGQDG